MSLFTPDSNSAEANRRSLTIEPPIPLTQFGELEVVNAIRLREFRRELSPHVADAAIRTFHAHRLRGIYKTVDLGDAVWREARNLSARLTKRFGVRTLDIIHVASAIVLRADEFHTFDLRQIQVARAAGLNVP
jgi:predicted nucleic acid-binding protein